MRGKFLKLLALCIMTAMLVSCFTFLTSCGEDDGDDIVIGALVTLSGPNAYYGNDMLNSYKLAVEEINAAGGVLGRNLKIVYQDDAGTPTGSTTAASKLISRGNMNFAAGGYSSGAIIPTMQQFYDANMLLLISNSNSTDITKGNFNQSFMINNPSTHAVVILKELLAYLGSSKVSLIHQGDAYTKDLADICRDELPKSGYEIAYYDMMAEGALDVSAIVTNIVNAGADFVYFCGYHADASTVIKQLRRGGYEGEIAVGDGSASVELIEFCGADGEGVYITSPPFVKFTSGGEKFISDYKAKYGIEPGTYAALNYDTIYLLKEAIEKAGTIDMTAVRDALMEIEFKGLSGPISFNASREPAESKFMILQIKDGDFVLVTP